MDKKEFLDVLYEQLSGQMPEGTIAAHVQYYRNYIEDEQCKGRSEEDILNELGDPRLITRTLLDAEGASGNPQTTGAYSTTYDDTAGYDDNGRASSGSGRVKQHSFHLDLTTWYGKLAVILIAIIVVILLCTILSVLIPIMLIAGVILYVFRLRKR